MEGEFLDTEDSLFNKMYTEIFKEVLPFYLSIGMTYDEFYLQDVELAKFYRQAYEIKEDRHNSHMWLQGMYIYDAISSSLYNVFCRKSGQQASSYSMTSEQKEEDQQLIVAEEQAKVKVWMNMLVNSYE
ncbi:hypothetical protein H7U28_05635 [Coprobacillus cateniformis]|nr:hypothetical protein [Coprobacillus cateniformis]